MFDSLSQYNFDSNMFSLIQNLYFDRSLLLSTSSSVLLVTVTTRAFFQTSEDWSSFIVDGDLLLLKIVYA